MQGKNESLRLECPTGLVLELYREWWFREKYLFADHLEYCQDLWDSNVAAIWEPGPYDAKEITYDVGQLQQQDWNCFFKYLEARYNEAEAARRKTFKFRYEKAQEYGQRVVLAGVAFWAHVFEGTLSGVESVGQALRTNNTNVPATPFAWHVERIKRAWKGK